MTSATRVPVFRCTTGGCPAPDDAEWHRPWCQGVHECFGGATHQHWPKKGMGGNNPKSKIVACLCAGMHDRIDNGDYGNAVFETIEDGKRISIYRAWDLHNNTLIEQIIGIDDLEVGSSVADDSAIGAQSSSEALTSLAALPPTPGESGEASEDQSQPVSVRISPSPRPSPDMEGAAVSSRVLSVPPVTIDPPTAAPSISSWCWAGMKLFYAGLTIKGAEDDLRFSLGDWANRGVQWFGEPAYAYFEPFKAGTIQQYAWVAGTVSTRVYGLSWAHHRAVAALPEPEQREWLERAKDEQMTTRELHRAIHGEPPKVRRWSFAELEGHLCHTCREVLSSMEAR